MRTHLVLMVIQQMHSANVFQQVGSSSAAQYNHLLEECINLLFGFPTEGVVAHSQGTVPDV